jgi:hypothetical protein
MKRFLMCLLGSFVMATTQAQSDGHGYIVKTKGAKKVAVAEDSKSDEPIQESEPQDFFEKNFRFVSLCDWQEGMRFMVIPDKKDMVIKTFADASTGMMVPSSKLRHMIMTYKGHDNNHGGLHERIYFNCEDDGKEYYYEVPTLSFDDYCHGPLGIPTLAYLGDVDVARQLLTDTTLFTLASEYYVDTQLNGDGFETIKDVPVGTEVQVKAIGVGTRNFPVKVIVADKSGREFYQNVAISRTNSGLRNDEYQISNMVIHTFKGAFELLSDNMAASKVYQKYIGQEVYTLFSTAMADANGRTAQVARLSTFVVKDVQAVRGRKTVKLTLRGVGSGREYTKEVMLRSASVIGDIDGQHEESFSNLFAMGNPLKLDGVKKEHMNDIQKSIVRIGYSENEVRLALGEPTHKGSDSKHFTWVYNNPGRSYVCVYFDSSLHLVTSVKK